MSKFAVTIDTDNDAFADGNREAEIARILRRVAGTVERGQTDGADYDINGNLVCRFSMKQGEQR